MDIMERTLKILLKKYEVTARKLSFCNPKSRLTDQISSKKKSWRQWKNPKIKSLDVLLTILKIEAISYLSVSICLQYITSLSDTTKKQRQ